MPRKKIVFIIVEGPSDDEALGLLFNKIFEDAEIFVHITYGDITTQEDTTSRNILARIGDIINSYAKSNHFSKNLFREIIHIVDTDGAYVPDTAIDRDMSLNSTRYSITKIYTANPEGIIQRNRLKSQCLDRMATVMTICGIPYHVYYMSCNLDHVLYNVINSTEEEKENNSINFARKYRKDIEGFIKYISASDFSVKNGYKQTWEYIRAELHSLERHTNLCVLFNDPELET